MANRTYLYATDRHPDAERSDATEPGDIAGLSEAAYRIPLSYRLLLSGAPAVSRSLIWPEDRIGLTGDFATGAQRLGRFLDRLARAAPELRQACADTRAFLSAPANRRRWVVLEAGEIFDMASEPLAEQTAALLGEIQAVDAEAERFLQAVAGHGPYDGDSVDARTDAGERNALLASGVGFWSTVLFIDLSPEAPGDAPLHVDAFANLDEPAPDGPPPRPPVPFSGPLISTAALLVGATLSGRVQPDLDPVAFAIRFLALYAAMTALWTLGVWGVWWVRHGRYPAEES